LYCGDISFFNMPLQTKPGRGEECPKVGEHSYEPEFPFSTPVLREFTPVPPLVKPHIQSTWIVWKGFFKSGERRFFTR
jgi:hypothetical protein